MAHFLNPESNVRISLTEQAVLVGGHLDVGLWGCDDFAGRELDVTSSGAAVRVERRERRGNIRIWRLHGVSVGDVAIEARTTSPPVSVWDRIQAGAVDDTWPPRPNFAPLTTNAEREQVFGRFRYRANPVPGNAENIVILGNW